MAEESTPFGPFQQQQRPTNHGPVLKATRAVADRGVGSLRPCCRRISASSDRAPGKAAGFTRDLMEGVPQDKDRLYRGRSGSGLAPSPTPASFDQTVGTNQLSSSQVPNAANA